MRKLYVKIAAAIWLVMILAAAAAFLAARSMTPADGSGYREPPWDLVTDTLIAQATSETDGRGRRALIEWFDERRIPVLAVRLLDAEGQQLAGPAEPAVLALPPWPDTATETRRRSFTHDGERYTAVITGQKPRRWQAAIATLSMQPTVLLAVLLLAVVLSLLVSIAIARYLALPLKSLAATGRRLGFGDLRARAGPAFERRGDEIADFATAFDQMAERIENLVKSHKLLLRDVSHELRSPLARAQAAVSLARQRTVPEVGGEFDRIDVEIARLDALIGKLLLYSRADMAVSATIRRRVDITGLVQDIVADAAIEARRGNRRIELDCHRHACVSGDAELLCSALENVVRNAVHHSPPGSSIDVAVNGCRNFTCAVEVRDRGPGVPDESLADIFEPFVRLESARGGSGGAGIGLAIARRVVERHGGEIVARNAAGGGLIVRIVLPCDPHCGDEHPSLQAEPART